MKCVLFAERAVLVEFNTLRIIFLVLHSRIVSLLAFLTCHGHLYSHVHTSLERFLYILNSFYTIY